MIIYSLWKGYLTCVDDYVQCVCEGTGKYLTCVGDYVQCVDRDWEVCDVWMIMYSVWEGTGSKYLTCVDDYVQCGKGLGSKYSTYVDDYVQCVGRDWEVSI